jgi:hypothetical protein
MPRKKLNISEVEEFPMRKDMAWVAKCDMQVLEKYSGPDVMLGLSNFYIDVFREGLRNDFPNLSEKELNEKMREILVRKRRT